VNGTGSASANTLLMKAIFRMGVPVMAKIIFRPTSRGCPPVRDPRDQGWLRRAFGRIDIIVR